MTITSTLMMSLALLAGAATTIGCSHNKGGRNGMPSATGTATAQNADMNRASGGADVGNGTDTSGNTGDTTLINSQAPQGTTGDTQSPPCNNVTDTGRAGNPNCDQGGTSGANSNASGTRSNGSTGGIPTTPAPDRP